MPAADLYTGRGAHLGRRAAAQAGGRLYFASAGLGLVDANARVPPYALTVADRGDDAIASRVEGRFDPTSWWSAVCRAPGACSLADVAAASMGFILIAMTRPYARLLAADLAALPGDAARGLRLFGWRLEECLPRPLHDAVMPYDARLDAVLPGTQNDFPQRAVVHFTVNGALRAGDDHASHRAAVRRALDGVAPPRRVARPKATDDEILGWIEGQLRARRGVQRLLRSMRDEGIACEQARFSRLYERIAGGGAP